MGMSKVRLLGIALATFFFAWTMLRTNSQDPSALAWHNFDAASPVTGAGDALDESKFISTDTPSAATLDGASSVDTPKEDVKINIGGAQTQQIDPTAPTLSKQGQIQPKPQSDEKAAFDPAQISDTKEQAEAKEAEVKSPELHASEGIQEAVKTEEPTRPDLSSPPPVASAEAANSTADPGAALSADPVRELTPEEKEEERKKAEQKKEKEMNELKQRLEREHEKARDASLRQLEHDPEMQKRIKVELEDVGIVIRTGKDCKERLAGPLSTWASERTTDNLVIFSDQADQFNGWQVQDAIQPWIDRPKIKDTPAAQFWREANQAKTNPAQKTKRFNGWNLDALKFVSAVHLGYEQLRQKRDFKWYIFADDDTYWHLPTLINLLSNLDYEMEYYTGGVSYFGIAFAHGGAGAVVSAGAMKKRFIDHADTIAEYHDIGATAQYGDTNLARAFEAVGIYFDHSFRENFNGENPFHRPLDRALICQHVVTFHHLKLEFFQPFHERVKNLPIMRYIDIMATLSEPSRPMTFFWHKSDWTFNLDRDDVGVAKDAKNLRENNWSFTVPERYKEMVTPKSCQEMCRDNEKCVAWTYIEKERTCTMSEWFRIGQERKGSTSGVDAMKLADWADTCTLWWPKKF